MTKCWGKPKAKRSRRTKGKKKSVSFATSGGDYQSKPKKGHTWIVTYKRGEKVPGSRRCKDCGIKPPGKGKPVGDKRWKPPSNSKTE